jgi:hypothetical protein
MIKDIIIPFLGAKEPPEIGRFNYRRSIALDENHEIS